MFSLFFPLQMLLKNKQALCCILKMSNVLCILQRVDGWVERCFDYKYSLFGTEFDRQAFLLENVFSLLDLQINCEPDVSFDNCMIFCHSSLLHRIIFPSLMCWNQQVLVQSARFVSFCLVSLISHQLRQSALRCLVAAWCSHR